MQPISIRHSEMISETQTRDPKFPQKISNPLNSGTLRTMAPVSDTSESIAFGRFRVLTHRRMLLADDKPVNLGGRAFDLLMVLIETPGAVVSKDDLLARVWPNRVVTETNLQTQILALRHAFGAERDLIQTIAGRGYQFTGETHIVSQDPDQRVTERPPVAPNGAIAVPTNLPQPVSELIGRDAEVEEISNLVRDGRLVTLTGAGGIGKTRLALAVGRRLLPQFRDGVWLAEFSSLSDPSLVPAMVAAAIEIELGGELSAQRVAQALAARHLLVVLDTCEHVIGAVATMAEALLRAGSTVHIIATSREPLSAEAEQLYRVPTLAVPTEDTKNLLDYGAVRLFVERARAAEPKSMPDRHRALTIAAICRRLDGIPLAIEMAAARVPALSIEELAGRLDDSLRVLTRGRRTALPRHQTLRATFDWSYELLPAMEQRLLRRLGVFPGGFTLDAATAVMRDSGIAPSAVVDGIANLVAKSLVNLDRTAPAGRWLLLETIRAYALEKLAENDEVESAAQCHAAFYKNLVAEAAFGPGSVPTHEDFAIYGREIDNIRAALDWSFSPAGDRSIGVALTVNTVPWWTKAPLVGECRRRVEQALASLDSQKERDRRQEMQLLAAWGVAILLTQGGAPEMNLAWTRALRIAEELDDTDYRLRALWGLFVDHLTRGHHRIALAYAERFQQFVAGATESTDLFIGERLIAVASHIIGDQNDARHHFERMLDLHLAPDHRSYMNRFPFDPRVQAQGFFARVLWLQGFVDQAMQLVTRNVDLARTIDHPTTLFTALALSACPLTLLTGDLAAADSFVAMLLHHSDRHVMRSWNVWAQCFKCTLMIRQYNVAAGLKLLQAALASLPEPAFHLHYTVFVSELAQALGSSGDIEKGFSTIDEALARCIRNEEGWYLPEVMRIKGELLLLKGAPGAVPAAEDQFRQALDLARRQGALSWELRAATSFARMLRDQGRLVDANALLQPTYARFTEGYNTADLKAAKALLDELF